MTFKIRNPKSEIRKGFTLIELLIVIAIILLLTAIGIGLGYKITAAADIERTKASIAMIMNGVERYYDEQGEWPGEPIHPLSISYGQYLYTDFLHKDLFRVTWGPTAKKPDYKHEDSKFADTSIGKTSLNKLDAEAVAPQKISYPTDKSREIWVFSDAFGKVMLYSPHAALGGRPLLVSAGEDGLFGPEITYYFDNNWRKDSDDDSTDDDNIRSDK